MATLYKILILLITAISFSFSSQVIPINNGITDLNFNSTDISKLNTKVEIGDLVTFSKTSNSTEYTRLSLPGQYVSNVIGSPELPQIHKIIEIPQNASLRVEIINYEIEEINLSDFGIANPIFPAQPSLSKSKKPEDVPFELNQLEYSNDSFGNKSLVELDIKGMLRSVRIANVIIKPIKYNPQLNVIKVYKNLEFNIHFDDADFIKTESIKNNYYSPYFEPIYKNIPNYVSAFKGDDFITYPVTYAIVSNRAFEFQLLDLINWKTEKGFHVITAYTDDIGSNASSIKNYLHNLYNNPEEGVSAPSFILLVGDDAQLPESFSSGGHVSDLDYGDVTGDMMPEMFYGRFSAQNGAHVATQVQRTIEYEKLEMNPEFLGKCLMISGVDSYYASIHGNGQINYGNDYYFDGDHNYFENTTYLYPESNSSSVASQIRNKVSEGVGFVNYTAHGYELGWADPSFVVNDVANLDNEGEYPLMIGNCCTTNAFDSGTCFGEALLRTPNKGAIGYIGGSNSTYWDEDYWWGVGSSSSSSINATPTYSQTGTGVYDAMFHENNEDWWAVTNSAVMVVGNLAVSEANSSLTDYYWEIYHLMGDPSLSTYLGLPESNDVSHLPFIQVGVSQFTIEADAGSYVAISKDGTLHGAGLVGNSGSIDLDIKPIYAGGQATIVVTAQNKEPYIAQVEVGSADGAFMAIDNYTIGGIDEILTFNENYDGIVDFSVTLENFGSESANNVTATLLSNCPYITMINNTASYGNVASGSSSSSSNSFSFEVNPNIPNEYSVDLTLEIDSENDSWEQNISLTAYAPVIQVESISGDLFPGQTSDLTINLSNVGGAAINYPMVEIQGGQYIDILSSSFPNAYYWDCGSNCAGDVGNNNTEAFSVAVQISSSAPIGSLANFTIITTMLNNDGFSNTISLDMPIGIINENFSNGFDGFEWEFEGNSNWLLSNESNELDGTGSIQSGDINDNQSSSITINLDVTTSGEISFYKKVSSESNYDYLRFYVDNAEQGSWSGEVDWSESVFSVSPGNHTFKWSFTKDGSVTDGSDCGWVDNITFPPVFIEPDVILGDSNYDGIVNILDVILVVNMVLEVDDPDYTSADLNGDGNIDILDIVATVNIVLGISGKSAINDNAIISLSSNKASIESNNLISGIEFDYEGIIEIDETSIPNGWNMYLNESKILLVDISGNNTISNNTLFTYSGKLQINNYIVSNKFASAVESSMNLIPNSFEINSVYPNPFNPVTTIGLSIPESGHVEVMIFNILGQKIQTLADKNFETGNYNFTWNATSFSSGLYFVKANMKSESTIQKIMLIK